MHKCAVNIKGSHNIIGKRKFCHIPIKNVKKNIYIWHSLRSWLQSSLRKMVIVSHKNIFFMKFSIYIMFYEYICELFFPKKIPRFLVGFSTVARSFQRILVGGVSFKLFHIIIALHGLWEKKNRSKKKRICI